MYLPANLQSASNGAPLRTMLIQDLERALLYDLRRVDRKSYILTTF
jgi:hypothetical protein